MAKKKKTSTKKVVKKEVKKSETELNKIDIFKSPLSFTNTNIPIAYYCFSQYAFLHPSKNL